MSGTTKFPSKNSPREGEDLVDFLKRRQAEGVACLGLGSSSATTFTQADLDAARAEGLGAGLALAAQGENLYNAMRICALNQLATDAFERVVQGRVEAREVEAKRRSKEVIAAELEERRAQRREEL